MLTAKEFKPDDRKFYSKGLYLWLKKNPSLNRIYSSPWNVINGYDPEKPVLMIGVVDDEKWFHGFPLRSVCRENGNRQGYAYGSKDHHVSEWKDVTNEFIIGYKKIGKCYIHGDWAHEFETISKSHKKCINCGKEFFRKSKRVTKYFWESK